MRIGFICDLSEEDFRFAAENGFKCVEYNGSDDVEFTGRADELAGYVKKYGVEFNMIGLFGRNYVSNDPDERAKHLADAKLVIDFCVAVGSPLFVTGAGLAEERPFPENIRRAVDLFGRLVEYAKTKGVGVALYNCAWGNFAVGPDAWAMILPELPDLGIKYDPSHAVEGRRDYLLELRDWGHKVRHVHAKGSLVIDGRRFPDPNPGMDQTDWGSLFALLYYHNYQGDVNVEQHSGRWQQDLKYPGLIFSKRYLEQFVLPTGGR